MDDRRRLLERVYSREGAAEEQQDYRDPLTGATVRMTPSQWALAEYDRQHPLVDGTDRAADSPADHRSERTDHSAEDVTLAPEHPRIRLGDDADQLDGAEQEAGDADAVAVRTRRRLPPAIVVAGAFILGVLVTVGVATAVSRSAAGPSAPATTVAVPTDDGFHPLPGPAIQEYFRNAPRVHNLPSAVTGGFVPTSFHEVAGSVNLQASASIFAAKRLDGQYCLVAVSGGVRVASTCATELGIADHGLTLTKDAVRDVDGRPLSVTVTWQPDGTLSWEATPAAG